jgi:hypothetical protein
MTLTLKYALMHSKPTMRTVSTHPKIVIHLGLAAGTGDVSLTCDMIDPRAKRLG